ATKQTPTAEDAKAAVPPAAVTTAAGGAAGATTPATPAATASARVVALTGDDAMRYNINEITAAPGEALRIELKNIGRMPKQTMSHNWVLLKPIADADVQKLAMDAATKAPNYLPADQSAIIAHTKMLGPG